MNTIAKTANHAILSHSSRLNVNIIRDIIAIPPKHFWGFLFLLAAIFLSALAITDIQAENRYLYANLQNLEQTRDALNMKWAQLLLEKNTLSSPAHIQEIAENQLGMVLPKDPQLILIGHTKK
jgi:cell division protein FtsL